MVNEREERRILNYLARGYGLPKDATREDILEKIRCMPENGIPNREDSLMEFEMLLDGRLTLPENVPAPT